MVALHYKETWNLRARLNHRHQEPGFPGRNLDYFHTISQEIRNWFRPNGHSPSNMAAFLNLLGKSKPAKLTSFYRRAPNAAGGLLCGARMTCPTHLQEWCLSVVPGWPAQHICMSGVYSPKYSSSKWQWESISTCVSDHSQVNQYSSSLSPFLLPLIHS